MRRRLICSSWSERLCWSDGATKDRLADGGWKQVVEIEMQLRDHPDAGSALAVGRNDSLDSDLEVVAYPEHARIDGAGCLEIETHEVRDRSLQRSFDERDQVVEEIGQPEIVHCGLEVGHAVLQGAAPVEEARVGRVVDRNAAAVGIDASYNGARSARDWVPEHARHRERPRPPDGVWKIPEPFAEIKRRRVGGERVDRKRFRPCISPFGDEAD